MAKKKGLPLGTFLKRFSSETQCQEYLASLRWQNGYVCSKCGCHHGYRLSNGRYQCAQCRYQTSVTAGTVLHKTHMPLTQWFLAFYFVSQDKRGISAVQLAAMLGTTYKTAWSMLRRIRTAMGQRDETHQLCGVIEFDDAYFGGPTVGKKRGRGTEKEKVFVALALDGTYTGTRYSNDEAVGSCNGTVTHVPGTNNLQWTDSMGGTNIGPFYSVPS